MEKKEKLALDLKLQEVSFVLAFYVAGLEAMYYAAFHFALQDAKMCVIPVMIVIT